MASRRILVTFIVYHLIDRVIGDHYQINGVHNALNHDKNKTSDISLDNVFNGVYTECLFKFSYTCLQKKTLIYLNCLNGLSEVSVVGDYIKFVKLNTTKSIVSGPFESNDTQELSDQIDNTVDNFFENHLIRFSALGKDVILPHTVETFVGRKKRKGGGGHGGGDDGGKKKMFMMAMMCMKMKMMMMVPAMMGMMGMMSFKGMMFSMMSFMMTKLMLLMKLLEKKGGGTTSWSSGGDAGWASSGGAGAWMPAGTADYGSGGYDSNGQWQSRSIIEMLRDEKIKPKMVYKPIPYLKADNAYLNDVKPKLRKRRSIIDTLHNAYMYWITKFLGTQKQNPKFKVINGVKYVYQPNKLSKRIPKLNKNNLKQLVITEEFNKGEISEPTNGRMIRRKFNKMKKNVKEAVDENPWE